MTIPGEQTVYMWHEHAQWHAKWRDEEITTVAATLELAVQTITQLIFLNLKPWTLITWHIRPKEGLWPYKSET